ncbi:outer membrane efflux protein BepC [Holospora elegans E1]|uniref:Outer membrane efflux protein BepC n=1 Tax=Holospora elegans E1 TaxID=1427503 RepID=A0A023DZM0_9PROT|nr:TolC family protein [Holospora elegans]GAJ46475.1 outer membrane efflux protein BepC [Holospora elegans E1]
MIFNKIKFSSAKFWSEYFLMGCLFCNNIYALENLEKNDIPNASYLKENLLSGDASSMKNFSLGTFSSNYSSFPEINLETKDFSQEQGFPFPQGQYTKGQEEPMRSGGLRAQLLALAKNRKVSSSLIAELENSFGKDLPEELRVLLKDPTFSALLPDVRPSCSFINPKKTAAPIKITKESALRPVGSLTDALSAAYYFNPELEAARKKINLAVNALAKAFSAIRPGIYLNLGHNQFGSFQNQKGNNPLARDSDGLPVMNLKNRQRTWENQATVSAKQTLFSGGGILANIMKAKVDFFASCWSYIATEQNVLTKVLDAFLDYLLADELLRIEELNAATLHMLFKASNAGFSAGIEKSGDRSLAAGQALMQGDVKVIEARKARDSSRVKFQALIGAPVDLLDRLIMPTEFKFLPKNVQGVKKLILKNNPSIQASSMVLLGKKHEVTVAASGFLPKIELEASLSRRMNDRLQRTLPGTYSNQDTTYSKNAQVGIGLTMPIYDRGLTHANFRTVEQEVKLARLELEQNKRTALWEGVQQWNMLSASLVNRSLTFRAMLFYTQALMNAQKEYDAGVLPIVDFTRIQDSWINACRSWITQRFLVIKSSVAVGGYLGRITAKYLKLPVALFDPKKYYEQYASNWVGLGSNEEDNPLFDQDPLGRKN